MIYASAFTEQELADTVAFYKTPSGESFMVKTPALMPTLTPVMADLMPGVMRDVMQRFCARTDCSALPSPRSKN